MLTPHLSTLTKRHTTIDMVHSHKTSVLSIGRPMQTVTKMMNFNSMTTFLEHFLEECQCMDIAEEMFTRSLSNNTDTLLEAIKHNKEKQGKEALDYTPYLLFFSSSIQSLLSSLLGPTTLIIHQTSTNIEQKHLCLMYSFT